MVRDFNESSSTQVLMMMQQVGGCGINLQVSRRAHGLKK